MKLITLLSVISLFHTLVFPQEWKMQDGGVSVDLNDVYFVNKEQGWAVGDNATIIATTDGGNTWEKQFALDTAIVFENVEFVNSNLGFVGGNKITILPGRWNYQIILLRTTNGGENWEECDVGFGFDFVFSDMDFIDENTGWVAINNIGASSAEDKQGIVLVTQDGGKNWNVKMERKFDALTAIGFWNELYGYSFWWSSFDNFGDTDVYCTVNGGDEWDLVGKVESYIVMKVGLVSPDTLWAFGYCASKSEDGGRNWSSGIEFCNEYGVALSDIKIFDSKKIWLTGVTYGSRSGILMSTNDSGDNWEIEFEVEGKAFLGLSAVSNGHAWIVGEEGLILHKDISTVFVNKEGIEIPKTFWLEQNYPNPFNPTTTIEFSIPKSGIVNLTVYDILGRQIETILNQHMQPGHHKLHWNASDVHSGIYFVRLKSGAFSQVRKVMVVR